MKKLLTLPFIIHLFIINVVAQYLILTNGKIFTSDTTQHYVEALAIKDGRILTIDTTAKIEKMTKVQLNVSI